MTEHLTKDHYESLAQAVADGNHHWSGWGELHKATYVGEIVAKERPRATSRGRIYTPERTKKFEKAVAYWGEQVFNPVPYPVSVTLIVHEPSKKYEMIADSVAGLIYEAKKDLDNCAKSILDGLNGVAWRDDRQIVKLNAARRYAEAPGFSIQYHRHGLTRHEYEQFTKVRRAMNGTL